MSFRSSHMFGVRVSVPVVAAALIALALAAVGAPSAIADGQPGPAGLFPSLVKAAGGDTVYVWGNTLSGVSANDVTVTCGTQSLPATPSATDPAGTGWPSQCRP